MNVCPSLCSSSPFDKKIKQNEESLSKIKEKYQNIQDYLNIENKIIKEEEERLLKNTKVEELSDLTEESD